MSDNKEFNMEEGLKELKAINDKLSDTSIPIEEAIKLYERGKEVSIACQQSLEQAKKKLIEVNPNLSTNLN